MVLESIAFAPHRFIKFKDFKGVNFTFPWFWGCGLFMGKLHIKDMKILRELDFDARQPVSQIARKVGLSPEVTAYRIKQLEKKGIITGYYPVIDLSKLGYMFCRYLMEMERVTPEIEKKFIEFASNNPWMSWLIVKGDMNIGLAGYRYLR